MSGIDGGNSTPLSIPTDQPVGSEADACDITERTRLNSPNYQVVSTLRTGDVLSVTLEDGPPLQLLAKTEAGKTAGSITSPNSARLITCIQQGWKYKATVLGVQGGLCNVEIAPNE